DSLVDSAVNTPKESWPESRGTVQQRALSLPRKSDTSWTDTFSDSLSSNLTENDASVTSATSTPRDSKRKTNSYAKSNNRNSSVLGAAELGGRKNRRLTSTSSGILSALTFNDSRRNSKRSASLQSLESIAKQDADICFLDEIIQGIKKGEKPSIFYHKRVERLLEQEKYRNFVMAQLNFNLDQPVQANAKLIQDYVSFSC
ncbi:hypothetical protein Ciccas_010868, partial [Cichlidogyrus casuarinus]